MKIKQVTNEAIVFDDGYGHDWAITFSHDQDCCEYNYADFKQLEPLAYETEFDEPLQFEAVHEAGFRFGNNGKMFFVPCYSEQNGYYSTRLCIHWGMCGYNLQETVLYFCAELVE